MSALPESPSILSFEDARRVVEEQASGLAPRGAESIDLLSAAGRVLAEPLTADRDFPPFPRATRDGYAVRSSDLAQVPAALQVIAEIKAGAAPEHILSNLSSGQAASIMTGATVPPGADAVAMVEYTSRAGDEVKISRGVRAGENVVPIGAEARRGDFLLKPGVRLDAAAVAIAASIGKAKLDVYLRPQIAVLSTGDEVVDIRLTPGPNQIRNSNSYSLAAQIVLAGGEPVLRPIAPDEPNRLKQLIEEGLKSHLLLLTGGVSMGKYDLVEQVLTGLHAEFFFTGAEIQPGRPIVFGRCGAGVPAHHKPGERTYFFGLPGNPVSTMVTFELFARPAVEALAGMASRPLIFLHAKLQSDIKTKTGLKRFLPAILTGKFEDAEVELVRWQGSGDMAAMARANCFVVIPPDRERIAAGEWVAVMPR